MIWLVVATLFLTAYGWAHWLSTHSAAHAPVLLPLTLTVAIAPGTLSLIMFYIGLLQLPITFTIAFTAYTLQWPLAGTWRSEMA